MRPSPAKTVRAPVAVAAAAGSVAAAVAAAAATVAAAAGAGAAAATAVAAAAAVGAAADATAIDRDSPFAPRRGGPASTSPIRTTRDKGRIEIRSTVNRLMPDRLADR